VLVLQLTGCASERVSGNTATYTYSWGVAILAAIGSVALAVLGVRVIREERQFGKKLIGLAMVAGGLLFLLGFTPRVFFTYVTVDAGHVEGDDRALWFVADAKKQFNIPLADVVSLEERAKTEFGRRRKTVKYLVFHRSTGGETELLLTSLLSAARPRIEETLKANSSASPVAKTEHPASPAPNVQPPSKTSAAHIPPSVADKAGPVPPNAPPQASAATDAPKESTEQGIGTEMTLKVGMPIEAEWGNKWWPAQVVQLMANNQVKIHYEGWTDASDEVLPRTRLRLATVGTPIAEHTSNPVGTLRSESVGNVKPDTTIKKGQRLETYWGSKWWDAHVVEVLPDGSVKVHYEGWSDNFDETVPRDRLRVADANK